MAAINQSAFEVRVSNHEFDSVANITGIYNNDSGEEEICAAGFLCVRDSLAQNVGYPTGVLNGNTWVMTAAPSTTTVNEPIYACNTFNVNQVSDGNGNVWKVGANTLGLAAPAGETVTFTKIDFTGDRIYRFGVGNAGGQAAIGNNKYFTIDDGMLVPAAAAPATNGAVYFELLNSGVFTEGAWSAFGYIDVQPKYVIA